MENNDHDFVRNFASFCFQVMSRRYFTHGGWYREYFCKKCKSIAYTYKSDQYKIYTTYYNHIKHNITCNELVIKQLLE